MGKEVKPVNIRAGLLLGKCRLGLRVSPGDQQLESGVSLSRVSPAGRHTGCSVWMLHKLCAHYFELRQGYRKTWTVFSRINDKQQ